LPGRGAIRPPRSLFGRHGLDDADQQREDDAADCAAGDIAHPAFDHLAGKGADQLAENAAADRTGNGVAQGAERILLGCGARRAAADRARYELSDRSRETRRAK
jgi:hypothetical protein